MDFLILCPFWDLTILLRGPLWDMTILRHDIFPTETIMRHDHFETWHFSYINHYETWPFWDMTFFLHQPLWDMNILRHDICPTATTMKDDHFETWFFCYCIIWSIKVFFCCGTLTHNTFKGLLPFMNVWYVMLYTLMAKMFRMGDFWLETRVIIKILTHAWYPRTFDWFSWGWSKIFF